MIQRSVPRISKKIFEIPLDYFFDDEKTYGYPYFGENNGNLFFTYHLGGGSVGSTYKLFINEDDTTTEVVHIGPLIGSPSPDENELLLNWATICKNGNYSSSRAQNHETEYYDYMICTNDLVPLDLSKIYKRNKTTNEVTLVSDKPTGEFKYSNGKLYFVSNDHKLYSLSLNDESVKLEGNGPISVSGHEYYQVLGDNIYYINTEDGKIYKEGSENPVNSGEKGESILMVGDYAVLKFESTLPSSYRTVIYDREGNEVFKLPGYMNIVSSDLNRLAYFDEDVNKIFLVEFN